MPYTPNNAPYVPGDPYSYDLKWILQKLAALEAEIESLEERVTQLEEE